MPLSLTTQPPHLSHLFFYTETFLGASKKTVRQPEGKLNNVRSKTSRLDTHNCCHSKARN